MRGAGGLGRSLVANTLHAASGRVASLAVWLLYTPFILHALGDEPFALWSLFFAVTGTLYAFDFGFAQATLRFVAEARARDDHRAGGAFATLAMLVYGGLGAVWVGAAALARGPVADFLRVPGAFRGDAEFVLLAGAAVFVLIGLTNVTMAVAQGYGRFDLANRAMLALTAQHAVGIPVVLGQGWGVKGLVVNVGLGWLSGLLLCLVSVRRAIPEFRWTGLASARARARDALAFGGPMQVAVAAFAAHHHLDKFLLSALVALAVVAPYELGFRVANAALSIPQLLLLAVLPAAAAMHARGEPARLMELYRRGNRYVLTVTAVLFTAIAVSAERLYAAWLGEPNPDAALVLRGLAISSGLLAASGMGTSVVRGLGRTGLEAAFASVVLAVHAVLAVILLPRMGLQGAVIAMIAGSASGLVVFLWGLARVLGVSAFATLVAPHLVPVVAIAAGGFAGAAVDGALEGVAGWPGVVAVSGAAALTVLAIHFATRYLAWDEVRSLLLRRGSAA